MEICVNVRTAC